MSMDELEKQLGLSSDEDSTSFEKSREELDEIINLLNESEESFINLDEESEEVLNEDEIYTLLQQDENLKLEEIDYDAIENASYDDQNNKKDKTLPESENLDDTSLPLLESEDNSLSELDDTSSSDDDAFSQLDDTSSSDDGISNQPDNTSSSQVDVSNQENDNSSNTDLFNISSQTNDLLDDTNEDAKNKKLSIFKKFKKSKEDKVILNNDQLNNKNQNKGFIVILSGIIFLIVLIIITIIFFVFSVKKVNSIKMTREIETDRKTSQYVKEDRNSTSLNLVRSIDNMNIVLDKILIDPLYTCLYFDNYIDLLKYDLQLTDSDNKIYTMDLNFTKNPNDEGKTVARFSPLSTSTSGLYLTMTNIESGEKVVFNINITKKIETTESRYVNSPLINNFDDFDLNINYATFSDAGSRIDYSIEVPIDSEYQIKHGFLESSNSITLKENEEVLNSLSNRPVLTYINDNTFIGRMDFDKVDSYDSKLILEFDNLYKEYSINKSFTASAINKSKNVALEFDNYSIILEAVAKFDDEYVLVFHGEDKTISTENRPSDYNRVEVSLDAELSLETSSGVEVILTPTTVTSGTIGTDMLFNLNETQLGLLNSVSFEKINVNIKSALLKLLPVQVAVDLKKTMTRKIIFDEIMETQLTEAFGSRLKYKAGKSNLKSITGFSEEIIADESIMNQYEPLKGVSKYSTAIDIISQKLDGNHLDAIVQEALRVTIGDETKVLYATHVIEAYYENDTWTIISDRIMR